MRTFSPIRGTNGPVTVSYAADVVPAMTPRRPGPSYDLRGAGGGFGGAFFSFLLLPLQAETIDLRLSWNMSRLPAGACAVSTEGGGDVAARLSPFQIYSIFFLAGNVVGEPPKEASFHAYWIGRPPFDSGAAADWSARTFALLETFFDAPSLRPYTLLMHPYPRPRDGGGAFGPCFTRRAETPSESGPGHVRRLFPGEAAHRDGLEAGLSRGRRRHNGGRCDHVVLRSYAPNRAQRLERHVGPCGPPDH
jgi:hypothetical protein